MGLILVHVEQVEQIVRHDRVRTACLVFHIELANKNHHLRGFVPEILHMRV